MRDLGPRQEALQACNVLNPFVPSSLPNCALHPPASVCLLLLWGSQRQADAQGCCDPAGICSWEDTGEVAAMQTGPACSLPSFTAGALPPAALHSSPSPHQASPQGKLCPCCPGPAWAPGVCGQRCESPSRCLVATNVVGFCLGALWCGCSSPGDVLCMANKLLVAPGFLLHSLLPASSPP